ncbi:Membrane protein CcdC involved in cytochrome C biogenesis [Aneurinibacillus migulanus]|uniref:Membrane protein CcdC involved in cytochrome C biogenesis n=2 Tax=Aneurinibacillus migulanus TaxID=47500 RepID=A0A1G8R2A5_ANEMI|nr:membrane protein [Aneurinibacillus migulanus]SDJ11088.1 Membrane protein CcdC involved in cytochrome C biogenesis [Aneurinibacillus migulanus]
MTMTILSGVIGIFMATIVLMVRMRASKKPASLKKIILPPFFMSTGFAMFLYPPMHVHVTYALFAFFVGALLSYPLIVTSKFEVVGRDIYLKRSKAFFFILVGLVLLRLALKSYVGMYVSIEETAGLFFILAFGMIVPWRVAMYFEYVKLNRSLDLT